MITTKQLIISMTNLVEKHTKRFKTDLKYDIEKIEQIDGFFHAIYFIRESGTHLIDLSNKGTDFDYLRHYIGCFGNKNETYIIATNDGKNWEMTKIPYFAQYREQF